MYRVHVSRIASISIRMRLPLARGPLDPLTMYHSHPRSAAGPGRLTLSPPGRLKRVLDKVHLHLGDLRIQVELRAVHTEDWTFARGWPRNPRRARCVAVFRVFVVVAVRFRVCRSLIRHAAPAAGGHQEAHEHLHRAPEAQRQAL